MSQENKRKFCKIKQAQMLEDKRKAEEMRRQRKLPMQNEVKEFYEKKDVQIFWAAMILLNFLISAINSQMLPEKNNMQVAIGFFRACEFFFAYVFLFELIINFYGRFFCEFWTSAWNIFDFIIVGISLLSLYLESLPGISVLRLFRAFRVVRLFKRIKSMKKMMDSIMKSLPGMAIAFSALFLIMGIYSIIGVNFWGADFPGEYGNFLKGILTLLQVMTFDSWCSGIARDLIFKHGAIPAVYFISYVFIAAIIMANVLISLLLDKFLKVNEDDDDEDMEDIIQDEPIETKNLTKTSPTIEQRLPLPLLPENRVIDLSTTNSTADDIEGELSSEPGIAGAVKPVTSPLYNVQQKRGHREIDSGESVTLLHFGGVRRARSGGESVELLILEDVVTPEEAGFVPSHQRDQWRVQVENDITTLMQSVNILNSRLERAFRKIDKISDKLSTAKLSIVFPSAKPYVSSIRLSGIKLSGVAI